MSTIRANKLQNLSRTVTVELGDQMSAGIGYTPAGTGAVSTTVESKLRETVSVLDFGADPTGATDSTAAIQAACSASNNVYFPEGSYLINIPENSTMVTYTSETGIVITGENATIIDNRVYADATHLTNIFKFVSCTNVTVSGINYIGQLQNVNNSQLGATIFNVNTQSSNVTISSNITGARYGVLSGDYTTPSLGYNNNIKTNLVVNNVGYGVAFYLPRTIDVNVYATDTHRAVYVAGAQQGTINASFANTTFNAAAIQVLISDAYTGVGTSRGSSALKVTARDRGTTSFSSSATNYCAGISLSRVDPGTTYEDIDFNVYLYGTDTIATKMSLFTINSSVTSVIPSYPFNWEQSIVLNNISVTGVCDRSTQTIAENAPGNIIVQTIDGVLGVSTHYATVNNFNVYNYTYRKGSGTPTAGHQFILPGLTDIASFDNCDFGNGAVLLCATNATSNTTFNNCNMLGSWAASGPDNSSTINFANCTIYNASYVPLTNKVFVNTSVQNAQSKMITKVIKTGALSGASKTLVGAIPLNCVVYGVSGIISTAITGASGYKVGIATDLTRYADKSATTLGSVFSAIGSGTATTPINYNVYTDLVITAKTSNFTGGELTLAIHYYSFDDLALV